MLRTQRRLVVFLATAVAAAFAAATGIAQNITTDFSGEWTVVRSQDNTENPWVGDFFGLPLNADGLARAETWDASLLSLPEYQCRPHGWAYIYRGPTQLRISKEIDPYSREIVAYQPEWHQSTNMPVFLDGREHPPAEAVHSWGGFSTAQWEGDMLRIETSHLKEDYIRRDGAMATDEATRDDVVDSPRRHPDVGQHHPRPDVPRRAADSQLGVPADGQLAGSAAPVHVGVRGAREGQGPALPARRKPVPERHPRVGTASPTAGRRAAWRRSTPSTSRRSRTARGRPAIAARPSAAESG